MSRSHSYGRGFKPNFLVKSKYKNIDKNCDRVPAPQRDRKLKVKKFE
jgi:hypothetical protein